MAEAEIHYVVRESEKHQQDVEDILAAIGEYQAETPFQVVQTATINEHPEDVVMLKLVRTIRDARLYVDVQHTAELMRSGVEKHFSDEDRARLSARFAGIAIYGDLETE